MEKKLLVICGPTAMGKTSLALHLAKKFDGELISADSRQIYKGLDIGTGKDIPECFEFRNSNLEFDDFEIGYYTDKKIRLWCYDLVEPTQEFSVAQYAKIVREIIRNIWSRNKLPILVGGTGLYLKGVVDGIATSSIPKNKNLRKSLEKKSANELFEALTKADPAKAASMNASDKKNPRRLIRAIEVALHRNKQENSAIETQAIVAKDAVLLVGLRLPKTVLGKRIEVRVEKRIEQGIETEIKNLLAKGIGWNSQAMQSLGYRQWQEYFEKLSDFKNTERNKAIENWKQAEKKYAKRQMTWFKRDKRIIWFDTSESSSRRRVEKLVRKWYSSRR